MALTSLRNHLQVTFELTSKELEYVGQDLRPVLEPGVFLFGAGPAADCRAQPETCVALTVSVSDRYQPPCAVSWPEITLESDGGDTVSPGGDKLTQPLA